MSSLHYQSAATPKVSKTTAALILVPLFAGAAYLIHQGTQDQKAEAAPTPTTAITAPATPGK